MEFLLLYVTNESKNEQFNFKTEQERTREKERERKTLISNETEWI
jgi:hypothetical protein